MSSTDWHVNKSWRIYYGFKGKRQAWENEWKFEECEWKTRKYDTEKCEFKDLKT